MIIETICLSPILSAAIPTGAKMTLSITTVILIVSLINKTKILKILLSIFALVIIFISYRYIEKSSCGWGNLYNQMTFFFNIIYLTFVIQCTDLKKKRMLIIYFFLLMVYLIIDNILIFSRYGFSILKYEQEGLIGTNYGGTTFNTTCFFFLTACYVVFLMEKKKWPKIVAGAGCLLAFIYIFFCGARGTVVLLSLFVLITIPIVKTAKKRRTIKLLFIAISLCFFVLLFMSETIIDILIDISPERLSMRFKDIKMVSQVGLNDHSLSGRYGLYWVSIESFFSGIDSFLFGIGDHRGSMSGLLSYEQAGIGGHSEILDHCARFGLLGIIVVSIIFKNLYNYLIRLDSIKRLTNIFYCVVIAFVMCASVKAVLHPNIGCAVFLMTPLSFMCVNLVKK